MASCNQTIPDFRISDNIEINTLINKLLLIYLNNANKLKNNI